MSNHFITLAQAIAMTKLYRTEKEVVLLPEYRNTGLTPLCEKFDRAAFDALLAQPGCIALRTYLGMDENKNIRLITVGVNASDEDMVSSANKGLADDGDLIVEDGLRCPYTCPPPSPLNED